MDFKNVKYEKSFGTLAQLPPSTMPEVAFIGRSNVGKSSLLNKLCGKKGLAGVSSKPGKTATINFFKAGSARLVDLPGYGFAQTSKKERERLGKLIEGYLSQDRNLVLVCSLIDIRHDATKLDVEMISFLREAEVPFFVVLTKGDKLSKGKCAQQKAAIRKQLGIESDDQLMVTSSEKGTGINDLRQFINMMLGQE
ncbi:MAG: ribosome biogenesis GTP-binding protein YihA/YsxC [Coriobacteriales bacterium]|jgi:GTP-binding protein